MNVVVVDVPRVVGKGQLRFFVFERRSRSFNRFESRLILAIGGSGAAQVFIKSGASVFSPNFQRGIGFWVLFDFAENSICLLSVVRLGCDQSLDQERVEFSQTVLIGMSHLESFV